MKRERTIIVNETDAEFYFKNAVEYPIKNNTYYHYTKPFSIFGLMPDKTFFEHLYSFLNMLKILNLPGGSKILDVGSGPGWVCEYLWRCGYKVTGIDISPEFVKIANERTGSIRYVPETGSIKFETLNIEREVLNEKFDAVIFYDTLHHIVNEREALLNVKSMLHNYGVLFIREGNMPPKGSEGEKLLLEAHERYGTLESPYSYEYLVNLLMDIGFVNVTSYVEVNGAFIRSNKTPQEVEKLLHANFNSFNIIKCRLSSGYSSRVPNILKAEIILKQNNYMVAKGRIFNVRVYIKNRGDTLWISDPSLEHGAVAVGIKLFMGTQLIDEFTGRTPIPVDLPPGKETELDIDYTAPSTSGTYTMVFDMVVQGITWFEQEGSTTTALDLIVT